MRKFVNVSASLFLCITLIGGCLAEAPIQRLPKITFSHLQAFRVDVAKIEVENRFRAPITAPHIEHLLPTSPTKAMEQWFKDRFQPVGTSGALRLVIEDARAIEKPLHLDKSFKGQFTKQQSQLYEMTTQASLHIIDVDGNILDTAKAKAERSITTREDISLNDRHKLWLETVSALMNDFNESIEPYIQSYLKNWLR